MAGNNMSKYGEIIEKLTDEQTEELAKSAACLSREEFTAAGIPQLRFARAEQEDGLYPSFKAMANCWDKDLIKKVWGKEAAAASDSCEVLISPSMGVCNSPYSSNACEDPYLAGAYIAAYTDGVKLAGLTPCVSCDFEKSDVAFMDVVKSERAFNEYYMRPYVYVADGSAFSLPYVKYGGEYGDIFIEQSSGFLHNYCEKGTVLCRDVPQNLVKKCLTGGNVIMTAAGNKSGGDEIPSKTLANSLDRTIDFAMAVQKQKKLAVKDYFYEEELPLIAAEQSCVLLKNEGMLPLKKGSVAVMGGISESVKAQYLAELFTGSGNFKAEYCEGYSFADDVTPELTEDGAALSQTADYSIIFLGFNKEAGEEGRLNRHTKLPAGQLALIDRIHRSGKKIIAVVGLDYPVDLSFADKTAAILLCPSTGNSTAQAVYNIITGAVSPSGRLARTWYCDTDNRFKLLKNECKIGCRKMGVFAGYRGYVPEEKIAYPFGFGLSYSSFEYSNLSVEGNQVKFTVKNTGAAAAEVVQVYVGLPKSAIVRPQMELKAFIRLNLKAGESVNLSVKLKSEELQVFTNGRFVTEGGLYAVYIGSSPQDIKLKGNIQIGGSNIKGDGEKTCRYKTGESNVFAGGYTLKPVTIKPPKSNKFLTLGVGFLTVLLLLAVLTYILYISGYVFVNVDIPSFIDVFFVGVATLLAIIFIFAGLVKAMKSNETIISNGRGTIAADKSVQSSFEQLFSDLYGDDTEDYLPELAEEEKTEKQGNKKKTAARGFAGKYDAKLNFGTFCRQMDDFISGSGISIGLGGARKVLSAMAASKVILLEGDSPLNGAFTTALGSYFGGETLTFSSSEVYEGASNAKYPFGLMLKNARGNPDGIHIAVIHEADSDKDAKLLNAFANCAYMMMDGGLVAIGSESVEMPSNVWFVFVRGDGRVNYKNSDFCNAAAVLSLELVSCDTAEKSIQDKLTYSQFMGMLDRLINLDESEKYVLNEDVCWKKIDKFEKYLHDKSGYMLGNRDSLSIERYSAVYLACDGEQNEALDSVMASKIALPAVVALSGAELEDNEINAKVESIFDESGEIKKVINSCSLVAG